MTRWLLNFVALLSLGLCVASLVGWVRSYRSPSYPSPSAVAATALARPLSEIWFDGVRLDDVIGFVRDLSGANVIVDWPALATEGIDKETSVNLRAKPILLGELIAKTVNAEGRGGYRIRDGAFYISTRAALEREDRTRTFSTLARGTGCLATTEPTDWELLFFRRAWVAGAWRAVFALGIAPADPTAIYQLSPADDRTARADQGRQPLRFAGFRVQRSGYPYRSWLVEAPFWAMALVFAIPPLLRLRTLSRVHRRQRAGLCAHCGYDLRESPERCPECGRPSSAGV